MRELKLELQDGDCVIILRDDDTVDVELPDPKVIGDKDASVNQVIAVGFVSRLMTDMEWAKELINWTTDKLKGYEDD